MSASRLGPAQEMLRKMSPSAVHPQRKRRTCVCRIWHRADTAQACHGFLADADCSCITIQKRGRDLKMRSLYDISVSTVSAKVFLDPGLGTLNVYSNMWTCYPFTAALNFDRTFVLRISPGRLGTSISKVGRSWRPGARHAQASSRQIYRRKTKVDHQYGLAFSSIVLSLAPCGVAVRHASSLLEKSNSGRRFGST